LKDDRNKNGEESGGYCKSKKFRLKESAETDKKGIREADHCRKQLREGPITTANYER